MKALYRIIFPNGKSYIGISQNPALRWRQHQLNAKRGMNLPVYRAMRKYGGDVGFEVLMWGDALFIAGIERATIDAFESRIPTGYNVALGGETSPVEGIGHTAQSREKMSQARKGTGGSTDHMKKIAAIAASKRQSPEYREKARQAALRRWSKPDSRFAISPAQREALTRGRTFRHRKP